MADSEQVARPAAVTQAKRSSYLRHIRIHMELLHDSLAGREFGCGVGQDDREEIDRRLLEIWNIASAAELATVDPRPAPPAPSGESATSTPAARDGKVIPFRARQRTSR